MLSLKCRSKGVMKMKRTVTILSVILFCITLCSCDPGTFIIEENYLEGVTTVELIKYDNSNQKSFFSWVPNQFDKLKPFDILRYTVLEELHNEDIDDFLNSFKDTEILHTYYAYDSPKDICLKLNYSNGNFLIIWSNYKENNFAGYIGEYLPDGTVLSFWGSFSALFYYEELVNTYFSIKLDM